MLEQIKNILNEYEQLKLRSIHDDLSDLPHNTVNKTLTRSLACIERVSGGQSEYYKQADNYVTKGGYPGYICREVIGVLEALHDDVEAGCMVTYEELIHGDMFSDFLEMARHLCSAGYKDAAAVIAGSSLEVHLKNLCVRYNIEIHTEKNGKQIPKKADTLNADLARESAYTKSDQKSITAWLGLRNDAAHGDYGEYTLDQVKLHVESISDFIARFPA
ncbi:hypothetical protein JYT61_01075 [bacterium AH-315-E10]|nr:hypothetical protein [bacterium AH-315-E10]